MPDILCKAQNLANFSIYGRIKRGGNTSLRKEERMDDGIKIETGHSDLKPSFDASAKRMLKVDVERYQSYLNDTDMTPAQKEEFLQAMWLIMMSFVELGFGVHPFQEVCGKDGQSDTQSGLGAPDALQSSHPKDDEKEQEPRP